MSLEAGFGGIGFCAYYKMPVANLGATQKNILGLFGIRKCLSDSDYIAYDAIKRMVPL